MKILIIFGTRPEVIKLLPIIKELKKTHYQIKICNTAQHISMTKELIDLFKIKIDYNLNVMKKIKIYFI